MMIYRLVSHKEAPVVSLIKKIAAQYTPSSDL
jgi:hypothetical protein